MKLFAQKIHTYLSLGKNLERHRPIYWLDNEVAGLPFVSKCSSFFALSLYYFLIRGKCYHLKALMNEHSGTLIFKNGFGGMARMASWTGTFAVKLARQAEIRRRGAGPQGLRCQSKEQEWGRNSHLSTLKTSDPSSSLSSFPLYHRGFEKGIEGKLNQSIGSGLVGCPPCALHCAGHSGNSR